MDINSSIPTPDVSGHFFGTPARAVWVLVDDALARQSL